MILWDLFYGFLRVGLFSFGGAYGAIPMIRDIVLGCGWLTDQRLSYMIAVSESTPGPIMLNLATYVGYSQAGLAGAMLATFAVVLPSFVIILLVTASMKAFLKNPYFQAALRGLKPCIIGIVLATGTTMIFSGCLETGRLNDRSFWITVILLSLMAGSRILFRKKPSPILLILAAGCLGILL